MLSCMPAVRTTAGPYTAHMPVGRTVDTAAGAAATHALNYADACVTDVLLSTVDEHKTVTVCLSAVGY